MTTVAHLHPFFDARKFPWWRQPEADDLHKQLYTFIKAAADIESYYEKCGEGLLPLNLNQAPDKRWREALENLAAAGALRKLHEFLVADPRFVNNPGMQDALRAVAHARPAPKAMIVGKGVVVLDRGKLRDLLESLNDDQHPLKVVLVRGGRKSGKSHGRFLFELTARDSGAIALYLPRGLAVSVDRVVNKIFSAMAALDAIPPGDTSDPAWYDRVCDAMLEVASERDLRLWIAADDLGVDDNGVPLLHVSVREFFHQVAMNTVNPPFRERFRLMLIDYPTGDVPTRWTSDIWDLDEIDEKDIGGQHVADLLASWAAARQRTLLEDQLGQVARDVIAAADLTAGPAPAQNRPRLKRLYDKLGEVLKTL